ncbi:hypothetical protein ACTQ45_08230 [Fundicoccus sp. Sow4_D5]|uniref:hypothetical protein n=1 Tax=unclassified Fundicoccus TaxID=2761543 RepID=UPI003F8E540D
MNEKRMLFEIIERNNQLIEIIKALIIDNLEKEVLRNEEEKYFIARINMGRIRSIEKRRTF